MKNEKTIWILGWVLYLIVSILPARDISIIASFIVTLITVLIFTIVKSIVVRFWLKKYKIDVFKPFLLINLITLSSYYLLIIMLVGIFGERLVHVFLVIWLIIVEFFLYKWQLKKIIPNVIKNNFKWNLKIVGMSVIGNLISVFIFFMFIFFSITFSNK